MDIRTSFAGLGRRQGITPAIVTVALVSVTLLSVVLCSCRALGSNPGDNRSAGLTVSGTVRSSVTGGPISGVSVTLTRDGELVETTETSVNGAYAFTSIEASTGYAVTASASIYIETATAVFAVSENHVKDITLDRRWPSEGTVAATVDGVSSFTFAPDGTIYITASGANKIRQIAPGADTDSDYAGTGDGGGVDGSLASATFNVPMGIAVSADGAGIYVADVYGHRIRYITRGKVSTIAGTGTGAYTGDGQDAKLAQLNRPSGIAVDTAGNVYITDQGNNVVRKISADGKISTIAGGGAETQDNGNALSASLSSPYSIAVDTQGAVYVIEGHRVRKITTAGAISTVIGTTASGPNLPQLDNPVGIAVDAAGTVYIADHGNRRVVKVTADGSASVLAGGLNPVYALAMGPDGCIYIYISTRATNQIIKY